MIGTDAEMHITIMQHVLALGDGTDEKQVRDTVGVVLLALIVEATVGITGSGPQPTRGSLSYPVEEALHGQSVAQLLHGSAPEANRGRKK